MDPRTKYLGDAELLENALRHETDPHLVVRYLFYLAQSFKDAGEFEKALLWYQRRVEVGGWEEEVYYAKYQVMHCQMKLGYKFEQWLYAGLDAFAYRTTRLEALYEVLLYCRVTEQYKLGYQLGKGSEHTGMPKDILFVTSNIHEWKFHDELAICAYWAGDLSMSARLTKKILKEKKYTPADHDRLMKNLGFCQKK